MQVHDISLTTAKGEQLGIEFMPVSLDTVSFTTTNAWSFLATEANYFPSDADSLVVDFTVSGENIEKVANAFDAKAKISFDVEDAQHIALTKMSSPAFAASGKIENTYRTAIGLGAIKDKIPANALRVVAQVEGLKANEETFASLGHIYDFNKSVKKSFLARYAHNQNSCFCH